MVRLPRMVPLWRAWLLLIATAAPCVASAPASRDVGAYATHGAAVAIKRSQARQSGSFPSIERAQLGHLRKQQRSGALSHAFDASELLGFLAEPLVLRDYDGDTGIDPSDLLLDGAQQSAR